jgi:flagellar L-ring protein precursor FlgH
MNSKKVKDKKELFETIKNMKSMNLKLLNNFLSFHVLHALHGKYWAFYAFIRIKAKIEDKMMKTIFGGHSDVIRRARDQNKITSAKGSGCFVRQVGAIGVCVMMWGCAGLASSTSNTTDPRTQAPVSAVTSGTADKESAGPTDGSLWDERGLLGEMFINPKARRVGDIITIRIMENASASNKAGTTTDRKSTMSAGITNFFNMESSYPSDRPFFNPFSSVGAGIDSQFEGTGSTQRSGALTAYMTARVVDVLPNGNLVIEGNREVRVNAENQMITLTGIVRPRDISADNVIQSTYIADARIAYSGKGVLNDRQRPGWLTRILDKVWPF